MDSKFLTAYKVEAVIDVTKSSNTREEIAKGTTLWLVGHDDYRLAVSKTKDKKDPIWAAHQYFRVTEKLNDTTLVWPPAGVTSPVVPTSWPSPVKGKSVQGASTSTVRTAPLQVNPFDTLGTTTSLIDVPKAANGFEVKKGGKVMVLGWYQTDDVLVTDGAATAWMKVTEIKQGATSPRSKPVQPITAFFPNHDPSGPPPTLEECKAAAKDIIEEGDGFFGGLGKWSWAVIEGVGLFAYGVNRLIQETTTMPLLRMFREPETWQYQVRLRKLDNGATAPAPPTEDDDGAPAAGYVDGGGFGAAVAATGGAGAGVAFSTLAFFSWPFRKWAGDEFVREVNAETGLDVAGDERGVWLTPVKDATTGKDIKRVGRDATGAEVQLGMMEALTN